MNYLTSYHSDRGLVKATNQDSLAIRVANTDFGKIAFAVVCDGMGGLSKGELASKEVITSFTDWFDNQCEQLIYNDFSEGKLHAQWENIVQTINSRLLKFGNETNVSLGTTLTCMFFFKDMYYIFHVGDSRAYEVSNSVRQLTEDQSVVAREIRQGKLTKEQALQDPRRSVLLQCIGASQVVRPDFLKGAINPNGVYLLCSDGFVHEFTDEEMINIISPYKLNNEEDMKSSLIHLTELVKSRGERDNISSVLIKTY